MSDTYVECMVKKTTTMATKFMKYFLMFMSILAGLALFMFLKSPTIGFFSMILMGVGAYYYAVFSEVEFEYLYVDKTITVDKIYSQSRRKRIAVYDVEKMEVLAPMNSSKLDDYKNRDVKTTDYSSGYSQDPEQRYVFYYEGKQKIIIEPSEAFVKAIYNVAPRKVAQN